MLNNQIIENLELLLNLLEKLSGLNSKRTFFNHFILSFLLKANQVCFVALLFFLIPPQRHPNISKKKFTNIFKQFDL